MAGPGTWVTRAWRVLRVRRARGTPASLLLLWAGRSGHAGSGARPRPQRPRAGGGQARAREAKRRLLPGSGGAWPRGRAKCPDVACFPCIPPPPLLIDSHRRRVRGGGRGRVDRKRVWRRGLCAALCPNTPYGSHRSWCSAAPLPACSERALWRYRPAPVRVHVWPGSQNPAEQNVLFSFLETWPGSRRRRALPGQLYGGCSQVGATGALGC